MKPLKSIFYEATEVYSLYEDTDALFLYDVLINESLRLYHYDPLSLLKKCVDLFHQHNHQYSY